MIFGQALGAGLCTYAYEKQSVNTSVQKLQQLLQAIAKLLGNENYGVTTADGKVGPSTTFALINLSLDGVAKIPVLNKVLDTVKRVPGTSEVLRNRSYFVKAMNAADCTGLADVASVYNTIISGANSIAPVLNAIVTAAPSTGIDPRFVVATLPADVRTITYPPGTVAIYEPAIGKYRLLIPA